MLQCSLFSLTANFLSALLSFPQLLHTDHPSFHPSQHSCLRFLCFCIKLQFLCCTHSLLLPLLSLFFCHSLSSEFILPYLLFLPLTSCRLSNINTHMHTVFLTKRAGCVLSLLRGHTIQCSALHLL